MPGRLRLAAQRAAEALFCPAGRVEHRIAGRIVVFEAARARRRGGQVEIRTVARNSEPLPRRHAGDPVWFHRARALFARTGAPPMVHKITALGNCAGRSGLPGFRRFDMVQGSVQDGHKPSEVTRHCMSSGRGWTATRRARTSRAPSMRCCRAVPTSMPPTGEGKTPLDMSIERETDAVTDSLLERGAKKGRAAFA